MNIDTKRVKIQVITQEISETLKQGQTIVFQGSADVIEARFRDRHDGSTDATYIAKPVLVDIRPSETNISIVDDKKLKEKSRSQALRQKCYVIGSEIGENADDLYERIMDFANDELDRIQDEKKL
jgi:hypothetical protein